MGGVCAALDSEKSKDDRGVLGCGIESFIEERGVRGPGTKLIPTLSDFALIL